ncbi:MAG: hypothetical protein H6840_08065 [Planctomycetes bacterium]|nr:hypothetical protein [Planctomycetota bacterium]
MPRELGKAKRADLTGHLPGEQAEHGSALSRFLEGAGQLKPLEEGTYLDKPSGNGNGSATEVPGIQRARSSDTEVAPAPAGGNGRSDAFDTHFDLAVESPFGDAEMTPELAFDSGPAQTLSLEPVTFEPSADTLSPAAGPEPEMLDSVPDLTSPELDQLHDEEEDARSAPAVGELAPASSGDTGMLVAEAFGTREDRLSDAELSGADEWTGLNMEDDNDDRPTDKLGPRPAPQLPRPDEDPTDLLKDRREAEEEKITSKVEPRRDVDPRTRDPNAVVRDTVNFYNQTQSLHEQKQRSGGFPTISPSVVNSSQPLGWSREPQPAAPDLFSEDDADTLQPGALFEMETEPGQSLSPAAEPVFEPMAEPSLNAFEEIAPAPLELSAETDLAEADKRETDKFQREDREPPRLPLPEGTDKVDKERLAREKAGARNAEPRGLEPVADEKVAGGKDTQRFYVAEILAQKPKTGDTTAELQPAEEGIPPTAESSDSSHDFGTETWRGARRESTRGRRPDPEVLPEPSEVHTDFIEHVHVSHADRIIPEIEEEADGDDTVDEEAIQPAEADVQRVTDKVQTAPPARRPEPARAPARRVPAPAAEHVSSGRRPAARETVGATERREPAVIRAETAQASGRVKRITDSLTQRLKQERAETLRLIEQAEAVALKLREASEASRTDLQAISERRTTIRQRPAPADPDDLHELPAESREPQPAQAPSSRAAETVFEEKPASLAPAPEALPSRRVAERVPTRAVGEIVDELQRTAERPPASLSELLEQASRRHEPVGGNGHAESPDDLDLLVAASARLRETIESGWEEDRISGRMPALSGAEGPASGERSARRPDSPHGEVGLGEAESSLSADLDRLWTVLDSRRNAAAASRATVVIPAPEHARITHNQDQPLEGWTQEMLWPTLAGIAGVTFALGALFVWVLFKLLG